MRVYMGFLRYVRCMSHVLPGRSGAIADVTAEVNGEGTARCESIQKAAYERYLERPSIFSAHVNCRSDTTVLALVQDHDYWKLVTKLA